MRRKELFNIGYRRGLRKALSIVRENAGDMDLGLEDELQECGCCGGKCKNGKCCRCGHCEDENEELMEDVTPEECISDFNEEGTQVVSGMGFEDEEVMDDEVIPYDGEMLDSPIGSSFSEDADFIDNMGMEDDMQDDMMVDSVDEIDPVDGLVDDIVSDASMDDEVTTEMTEDFSINGFDIPSDILAEGGLTIDIVHDLESANVFDMAGREQIIEMLSNAVYYPTIDEFNQEQGADYTEEEAEDGLVPNLVALSSQDGYVLL